MSAELGRSVLASLKSCGVRDILICPGARNAVFVDALTDNPDFNVIWHFEERSAGFFAVGRSAATDRPVAVITTSGTAAGELLPAMMEAYYSGVPLIAVTADRPRHFRGSGAPQAAEQLGIYGIYAPLSLDISSDESIQLPANLNRPVHINVCLNDPRGTTAQESPIPEESLTSFLSRVQRPLVIVGQLEPHLRADTRSFLGALGAPSYFEALSGLRGVPELDQIAIKLADGIFGRHDFDGVLRLGRVPTHRLWRHRAGKELEPSLPLSRRRLCALCPRCRSFSRSCARAREQQQPPPPAAAAALRGSASASAPPPRRF